MRNTVNGFGKLAVLLALFSIPTLLHAQATCGTIANLESREILGQVEITFDLISNSPCRIDVKLVNRSDSTSMILDQESGLTLLEEYQPGMQIKLTWDPSISFPDGIEFDYFFELYSYPVAKKKSNSRLLVIVGSGAVVGGLACFLFLCKSDSSFPLPPPRPGLN